jgi:hypothetical protein
MAGQGPFRYADRHQTSIRDLWREASSDPATLERLMQLLEDRDRDLENWLKPNLSGTYTPTLSGIVLGTGGTPTNSGIYAAVYCGTYWQLHVEGYIRLGTTGESLGAGNTISLPAGMTQVSANGTPVGQWTGYEGTGFWQGSIWLLGSTLRLMIQSTGGTYLSGSDLLATIPTTWNDNDEIWWSADLLVTNS